MQYLLLILVIFMKINVAARVHAFIINLLSTFNFSTLKKKKNHHIPTPYNRWYQHTIPNLCIDFYLISLSLRFPIHHGLPCSVC